ncbi:short-chain fatty acid transporter [Marivirga sp. S37H4]|uniref:Short-chain fatty acid transporter n=1 Tax=Marivirga aurantiaca TaxID=2802615 RepID=A0A934WW30_9BACT|nr:TIGR00366 family protein [Marivirga aurantiaca]MBK6264128.1 short-chain fatty acid transporter [Marivirga aurantiaca]
MNITRQYVKFVERYLPSPFMIAILLSGLTFILAFFFTKSNDSTLAHGINILGYWQTGFWELLAFTMQMVLILLLGHTVALTPFFSKLITKIADLPKNTAQAAFLVSLSTIFLSFFNWGLCLIFGAILTRKVGERFSAQGKALNYGLVGAAGYCGMMVWHGGLSGSAPLKVAESNHFLLNETGVISINETLFSSMNIAISICLIVVIPLIFYWIGKKFNTGNSSSQLVEESIVNEEEQVDGNKESLDTSVWPAYLLGGLILLVAIIQAVQNIRSGDSFIDLNYINFLLFGLSLTLHASLANFMKAVHAGIKGISGIIIQFPLYAGIMGIMKYSGLVILISDFFVSISNEWSFPILTFLSAGLVNFFVPSGGGQWAVQGPIVVEAAQTLGISLPKIVMALAYGDQVSNMLQPFWALPLLGITQLKAKDILPYSAIILLIGTVIFIGGLLLF